MNKFFNNDNKNTSKNDSMESIVIDKSYKNKTNNIKIKIIDTEQPLNSNNLGSPGSPGSPGSNPEWDII